MRRRREPDPEFLPVAHPQDQPMPRAPLPPVPARKTVAQAFAEAVHTLTTQRAQQRLPVEIVRNGRS